MVSEAFLESVSRINWMNRKGGHSLGRRTGYPSLEDSSWDCSVLWSWNSVYMWELSFKFSSGEICNYIASCKLTSWEVCLSAQAAVTKYCSLGSLNRRGYFLWFWRLGRLRSRCWQIHFLVQALFLPCGCKLSHCVLTWQREKAKKTLRDSSCKATNPIMRTPPSWLLYKIVFQRLHLQIPWWGS